MATFSLWDYLVLVVMLIISAGIGLYYRFTGGKQKTTKEYFLADGGVSIYPVSFSLMASFMSAITLLGLSTEIYTYGILFVVINFSYGFATALSAFFYLPVFYKLQATSAYEYLEKRFGATTRLIASITYSLQMILYMGVVLYAPALALEAVTGISKENSILIIGFVCTFYSTIGGMKAVLVTDVFQSLLMFAAIYCVIIAAAIHVGGIGEIWNISREGGRLNFFNFDLDPTVRHTWFSLIIGGFFTYSTIYACNQTQVQRMLTVKNLKASQKAMFLNWPILSLLSLSTCFSGLCLYAYYAKCDPLLHGDITSRDQLMPRFVVDAMGHWPGLSGIFVSGIFSASLSSVSAAQNSLAAVTLEDYIKPLYSYIKGKPLKETKSTLPSKIIAFLYGLVCIGVAFLAQYFGGILQLSLSIFGAVGGPLLGMFSLGMFTLRGNQRGAITGLIISLVFVLWIGFSPKPLPPTLNFSKDGCPNTPSLVTTPVPITTPAPTNATEIEYFWLYKISYMWYAPLGFFLSLIIGWIVSVILESFNLGGEPTIYTDKNRTIINADLFTPPLAKRLRKRNAEIMGKNFAVANGDFGAHTENSTHF
ncbi:putative sodium-dependent multivitamin transporter isoform X2 [Sitodiplosis mosellana]|uniref:putative sodium-dependent multivitamin transporter isoform X2 n=1 Tax=Sitodiplosis mosellana TaxID=263140 RepID=UPI0024440DE6|nr:putative sodium-dependent multivitamin transporter isoform X2 [Sitodiplosis mosellana]XP_055312418.1 putative sodium-dependent multivitamin transporter isoform X2 [Sitodiplosis mosellana]